MADRGIDDTVGRIRDLLLSQSKAGRLRSLLDSVYGATEPVRRIPGMLGQFMGDAAPGGALNPELTPENMRTAAEYAAMTPNPIGDVASLGLAADDLRKGDYGSAALNSVGMLPFVPAMGAVTAWHGSPHKFDKFSLDKIGTGEGAQAYGHGLYLAESPEVGKEYARVLTKNAFFDGKPIYEIDPNTIGRRDTILSGVSNVGSDARGAIPGRYTPQGMESSYDGPIAAMKALIESGKVPKNATKWLDESGNIKVSSVEPQLYKTDIPDEAVARFLDWDKPLSQQNDFIKKLSDDLAKSGYLGDKTARGPAFLHDATGAEWYRQIDEQYKGATEYLHKQGIPGIRYLDGGSRSAGQGSSNFVAFDPEMIRILERNGQATGKNPWGKGEWKPK